jgi:hypothetical protein
MSSVAKFKSSLAGDKAEFAGDKADFFDREIDSTRFDPCSETDLPSSENQANVARQHGAKKYENDSTGARLFASLRGRVAYRFRLRPKGANFAFGADICQLYLFMLEMRKLFLLLNFR